MNKLFLKIVTISFLFSTVVVEANQVPPPPSTPLPGLPIDSNIVVLFIAIIVFGAYKIYSKQKTSI